MSAVRVSSFLPLQIVTFNDCMPNAIVRIFTPSADCFDRGRLVVVRAF